MELRKVKELVELVNASNLVEVEVREGAGSIRVARSPEPVVAVVPKALPPVTVAAPAVLERAIAAANAGDAARDAAPGHVVRSPTVGMSYLSPGPDQPPFVTVGKRVKTGDTLILVEALKTIQPIEATVSGTVLEILIENGQPVEFDQPLFVIG
jgi:acetyl-CoA carboxylase biotin carboxyl carrier protein